MKKPNVTSRLAVPFFLNLFFTVFEILGGFYTGSVAILADAVHDLGDAIAIGLSWILDLKSKRKPDRRHTYGYGRYALLGGMISSLVLVAGAVAVIAASVPRILDPQAVDATGMIFFAIFGVIVNGVAAVSASKGRSLNEKAVGLHLFEDVFGWIAVLLGAIAMAIWEIPVVDAVLSLGFTLYILFHVFKNLKQIMGIFLEQAPAGMTTDSVEMAAVDDRDVLSVHHVHLWSVDGEHPLATLHAVVRSDATAAELATIRVALHERLETAGIGHATVEFEQCDDRCGDRACELPAETVEPRRRK